MNPAVKWVISPIVREFNATLRVFLRKEAIPTLLITWPDGFRPRLDVRAGSIDLLRHQQRLFRLMHYVIHAYDYTDANALDRRMAVRPAHLNYVRELKARGQFVLGGALLDPDDRIIGSMLILDLESDEQLTQYLREDPYIVERVWDKIDARPFRQAQL